MAEGSFDVKLGLSGVAGRFQYNFDADWYSPKKVPPLLLQPVGFFVSGPAENFSTPEWFPFPPRA
jgi:hypothetical protein